MFSFDVSDVPNVSVAINLPGGSFDVSLEPPTAEERLIDEGFSFQVFNADGDAQANAYRNQFLRRCRRVVAWSGVNDPAGKPLPFSLVHLLKLISKHPSAIDQLRVAFVPLYSYDEKSVGEHDGPSPASAAAGQAIGNIRP